MLSEEILRHTQKKYCSESFISENTSHFHSGVSTIIPSFLKSEHGGFN